MARLIGGPYDGTKVGDDLPDLILVGMNREPYAMVMDPDTNHPLGAYAWEGGDPMPSRANGGL